MNQPSIEKIALHKIFKEHGSHWTKKKYFEQFMPFLKDNEIYNINKNINSPPDRKDLLVCTSKLTKHVNTVFKDYSELNLTFLNKILTFIVFFGFKSGVYKDNNKTIEESKIKNSFALLKNNLYSILSLERTKKSKTAHNLLITNYLIATKNESYIKTYFKIPTKSKSFNISFYQLNNKIHLNIDSHINEKKVLTDYVFDLDNKDYFNKIEEILTKRLKNLYYHYHFRTDFKKFYKSNIIEIEKDIENCDLKNLSLLIKLVDY